MASLARGRISCKFCAHAVASTSRLQPGSVARQHQSTTATATDTPEAPESISAASSTSESAPSSSSPSSSQSSRSTTRVVAAILLSRPPRAHTALTPFEREFYRYSRRIQRAIGSEFKPEWYFRKGSQGEQAYRELVEAAEEGKELEDTENAQDSEADKDLHSLERRRDRTLYFLAKKNREQHAWQFPQGGVEKSENLVKAALRELHEEFGTELDVWQTGILPAAFHAYPAAQSSEEGKDKTKVFFMPARIMRGEAKPNKEEGLVDYAWCTREELKEKVDGQYYESIKHALAE